jgi:hypothetical protein
MSRKGNTNPHQLCLCNPPGPQDIPQQEADKGVIKNDVGVWVMSVFFLQQQEGRPGNKNQIEQGGNTPWKPQ